MPARYVDAILLEMRLEIELRDRRDLDAPHPPVRRGQLGAIEPVLTRAGLVDRDEVSDVVVVIDDDEPVRPDPQRVRRRRLVRGDSAGQRLQLVPEVPDIATAEQPVQLGRYVGHPRTQQLVQLREHVAVGDPPYDDLCPRTQRRTEHGDAADRPVRQAAVEPERDRFTGQQLAVDRLTVERAVDRPDGPAQRTHRHTVQTVRRVRRG